MIRMTDEQRTELERRCGVSIEGIRSIYRIHAAHSREISNSTESVESLAASVSAMDQMIAALESLVAAQISVRELCGELLRSNCEA